MRLKYLPATAGRKERNMPGYKDVIDAIRGCGSTLQMIEHLKMPPSKLLRVLRSPRFRQQMEIERVITRAMVQFRASTCAGLVMSSLVDMSVMSKKEESARKASMAVISRAIDMEVLPDKPSNLAPDILEDETFPALDAPPPTIGHWEDPRKMVPALEAKMRAAQRKAAGLPAEGEDDGGYYFDPPSTGKEPERG